MGFTKYVVSDIRALRDLEILKSQRFRQLTVVINFLGEHLHIITSHGLSD